MNTATKLAGFAAAVAAVFGGAMVVGAGVGPIDVTDDSYSTHSTASAVTDHPRGLAVAEEGVRLLVDAETVASGVASEFGFRIVDDMGAPVTAFDQLHERPLHLIVLSRNLVDYRHLHPTIDDRGQWTVDLPALRPGSYRVFADFQPTGAANLTLGSDIVVPGNVETEPVPEPANVANIDDYEVTLAGDPHVGDSELVFTVALTGEQVHTDPYLGAAGHLVAIRTGDLAYLHVHPHDNDTTTTTTVGVTFTGEFPTAGTYRLFFDFSHGGAVRTAAFTVVVPDEGH